MSVYDPTERAIINGLQGGFPLSPTPFRDASHALGLTEGELIDGIGRLLASGRLSRFGPLWNAERLGGDVCLCAMAVPSERFDEIADLVNGYPEVAHNYEREHALNMWFVVAADRPERVSQVIDAIAARTGIEVHAMPKKHEFFIGFRVEV